MYPETRLEAAEIDRTELSPSLVDGGLDLEWAADFAATLAPRSSPTDAGQ